MKIPYKPLRNGVELIIPSKIGDAGADARIMGFKKIINENGKKELIEIEFKLYSNVN
ncbi:MAG: hypothetical protein ACFE9Z_07740 [Promethearchaeota archaeon]